MRLAFPQSTSYILSSKFPRRQIRSIIVEKALEYRSNSSRGRMAKCAARVIAILIFLGVGCEVLGVMEDSERSMMGLSFPYGRGLDNELQLARLLLLPPRLYHPKRNSELINSLLGLPKNMNNAGK